MIDDKQRVVLDSLSANLILELVSSDSDDGMKYILFKILDTPYGHWNRGLLDRATSILESVTQEWQERKAALLKDLEQIEKGFIYREE